MSLTINREHGAQTLRYHDAMSHEDPAPSSGVEAMRRDMEERLGARGLTLRIIIGVILSIALIWYVVHTFTG